MFNKISIGYQFKGCVGYVMEKTGARLLEAQGVRSDNAQTATHDFYAHARMNSRLRKCVGHISLNFHIDDTEKLTDEMMVKISKEYMDEMNIKNTQYIIVRHHDTPHPHLHIVFNRTDNNGKTISDNNIRFRGKETCKKLKRKYGLRFASGKENVNIEKLRGEDLVKYQIYYAVKDSLEKSCSWREFVNDLRRSNIDVKFKYRGNSGVVQGLSFIKDDITFKASKVDRSFCFSKLDARLSANNTAANLKIAAIEKDTAAHEQHEDNHQYLSVSNIASGRNAAWDEAERERKKKKKKKRKL
jgi:hypothetical protein